MAAAAPLLSLVRSAEAFAPSTLQPALPNPTERDYFLPDPGTLVELSGRGATARTTSAVSMLIRAQHEGETALWITPDDAGIYGADLALSGADLDALAVVRVPAAQGPRALVRAAELALRSGGFGFAVIDFVGGSPTGPAAAWQGRLLGLAREHRARLVLLSATDAQSDSLGPLVTVRITPERHASTIEHHLAKVKHGGIVRIAPSHHRMPPGL